MKRIWPSITCATPESLLSVFKNDDFNQSKKGGNVLTDELRVAPGGALRGEIDVPGDKSISHRAVMFGALAEGKTRIERFLPGQDCLSTIDCFRRLGIVIEQLSPTDVVVQGKGLRGLTEPSDILDVGNSGTTLRLMAGILAGQPFFSVLTGDSSIRRRPMGRVTAPLTAMGAVIRGRDGGRLAPIAIDGAASALKPLTYSSPVASAQVKSALLLAGLYTEGETAVREPYASRDHTERMLTAFGAKLQVAQEPEGAYCATITGFPDLRGQVITVPGDISSAAFFLVAATIVPGSAVLLRHVGMNPTRDGVIEVLQAMGAKIRSENERMEAGEPVADLYVESASLRGTVVSGGQIPRLIDEIPILAVAALFAEGRTEFRDAAELRVKETDRIATVAAELRKFGACVEEREDGMIIEGGRPLQGATVESHGDHRIAMAMAVAALQAAGETVIHGASCMDVSFPGFARYLASLRS